MQANKLKKSSAKLLSKDIKLHGNCVWIVECNFDEVTRKIKSVNKGGGPLQYWKSLCT